MGPDGVAAMMAEMMPQMMEAMGPENMAMMMEKMQPGGMAKMEGSRLDTVKKRGKLICASRNDVPGYGSLDASGNNVGFDIDLCRAVASAVLGDPKAIEIRYISASERGPTIQSGEVDMLVRTVTWTTSRDSQWGNYVQTMFFDGQGFMVNKALGISSALELNDAVVCVTQGTTTELNLQDFSNQNNLNISALTFEDTDAVVAAYQSGQCDAFTNDRSQLAALGSAFDKRDDHIIPPEPISEEPLGPVVPHGDDQWFDVVKTVMAVLIYGEAYGVTSGNVASPPRATPRSTACWASRVHMVRRAWASVRQRPKTSLRPLATTARSTTATWVQVALTYPGKMDVTPCGPTLPALTAPRAGR